MNRKPSTDKNLLQYKEKMLLIWMPISNLMNKAFAKNF